MINMDINVTIRIEFKLILLTGAAATRRGKGEPHVIGTIGSNCTGNAHCRSHCLGSLVLQKKTVDNVNKFKSKAMSRDPSKRSKEKKLQRDNKLLLKRLLHAEKSYSTKEWRKQEEWRQGILSRMGVKKPSTTPSVVPSTLLNESHNNPGPSESQRPGSAPAKVFHKKPWQGTAIALNEQDRLHLCREVPPLRAASPVFKKPKKRPSTASVLRSSQVVPVPSDASLCRDREIKKLFKPSGAYMSSKVNGAPSTSRAY